MIMFINVLRCLYDSSLVLSIILRLDRLELWLDVRLVDDIGKAGKANRDWEHNDCPSSKEKAIPWQHVPLDHHEVRHVSIRKHVEASVEANHDANKPKQNYWYRCSLICPHKEIVPPIFSNVIGDVVIVLSVEDCEEWLSNQQWNAEDEVPKLAVPPNGQYRQVVKDG